MVVTKVTNLHRDYEDTAGITACLSQTGRDMTEQPQNTQVRILGGEHEGRNAARASERRWTPYEWWILEGKISRAWRRDEHVIHLVRSKRYGIGG